jgi:hypothetical protein
MTASPYGPEFTAGAELGDADGAALALVEVAVVSDSTSIGVEVGCTAPVLAGVSATFIDPVDAIDDAAGAIDGDEGAPFVAGSPQLNDPTQSRMSRTRTG